jgi:hypothetical protein
MKLLPIMMLMNGGGQSEADSNAMANFLPMMLMMSKEKTDEDGNVVRTFSLHPRHLISALSAS